MAKKKILYLITQSEWGGGQEYVYNLASNLPKNNFESLTLAGEGNGAFFHALKSQNLPIVRLKWVKRSINPLFDLLGLFELISVFKKEKPDVIHLNSSKIGFLGSLAAKLANSNAKIVYTAHGWVFNEPLNWLVKNIYFGIEKISAKWKNVIICVCEADKQIALKNNFKSKVITIPNAVNEASLNFLPKNEARNFLKLNANYLIIGTIANFYKTKGLDCFIKAISLLKNDFPAIKAVIIGEGAERNNLEQQIKNLKLENNIFLAGSIPEAHQYLKAFDLFVLPSVKEGLPYAILKAMAAGLPIVATHVGGLPEILPPECLIEPGNPQLMADKIKSIVAGRLTIPPYNNISFQDFLSKTFSLY